MAGGALDWTIANVTTWSLPEALPSGSHWVALTSRDRAGNANPSDTNQQGDAPYFEFTIDLVPPVSAVESLAAQQTAHCLPRRRGLGPTMLPEWQPTTSSSKKTMARG